MERDWIQKCFSSLQKSTVPVNIIAINNNSSDNSAAYIKKHYPNVFLINNDTNKGFGGANNQGLKKALELGGEYFFLLNQDAWVDEDTIENLTLQSKNNPEYGIISPLHFNGRADALDYNFSQYITPNMCKNLYSDFVLGSVKSEIYESGFICAAAWLLTKDSLKKVGGFSPTFYHYGEDDNYIHRLKFKKLKIGVLPTVRIYHDREKREGGLLKNYDFNRKKSILLNHSNPLLNLNIKKEIFNLSIKIAIRKLLLSPLSKIKYLEFENKVLKEFKPVLEENMQLSISEKEYLFLK